jgi:hypothetical protein
VARLSFALVAVAVVLTLAPAAPVPKGADKPTLYFPTKVGAKWVYDEEEGEKVYIVTAVEKRDESTVVTVGWVGSDGKTVPKESWAVSDRGLLLLEMDGLKRDPPTCFLKLPHQPGEAWDWVPGNAPGWRGVARKSERVQVPAGEYDVLPVDLQFGRRSPILTRWYALGVGLVKSVNKEQTLRVLKSFTPGRD